MDASSDERTRLAAVRAALPATRAGIFLNAGTCGPIPQPSADAMAASAERELTLGRSSTLAYEELVEGLAEARAACAAILGTGLDQVAVTHSTTEGMSLAVGAVPWQPGDRALTTNLEHAGLLGPLEAARATRGIDIQIVDVGDGGDDDRTLDAFARALEAGNVRLVAVSHVTWSTGARLPVEALVRLARDRGVLVAIDGAQSAGAIPVDVEAIGADFYATSGQKWLLGPEGTGALALRPGLPDEPASPAMGYFSFVSPSPDAGLHPWPDARRFETAGYARPLLAGLARSAGWLAVEVGLAWAHERAARLARDAADRLAEIDGVEVATPRERMATLVSFRIRGWTASRVSDELGRRVFAVVRSIPGFELVRLSIGFYTTDEEIARVLREVAVLAAHTPESLPARPAIQFLDAVPE